MPGMTRASSQTFMANSLSLSPQGRSKKLAPQARCLLLRPLPLRERATQSCHEQSWVRGCLATKNPSPIRTRGHTIVPSPARGEGTRGDTARRRDLGRLGHTGAETLMILRRHFVAGALDRAGTHPAPSQHDVRVRSVVEAVPALARRIDDVAFARRGLAVVGVDMAVALEHDEELVAMVMAVPLVARSRLEHGPTDHMIGAGGCLVDQELHLHVDPAVLALGARHLPHVPPIAAVHFPGLCGRAGGGDFSFGLSHGSLHHSWTPTGLVSRFRSSHHYAAASFANFGIEGH